MNIMKELGVSVYPEKASMEDILGYLDKAGKYGFTRVFTNLISIEEDRSVLEKFKKICYYARERGMKVIADINPEVLKNMNITFNDMKFFHDLGLFGIRLDIGFTGLEESIMTYNPYGIKIEINMSSGTKYLENIIEYKPNIANLLGCHNFYPLRYTGISRAHFNKCSEVFKSCGIPTAAFVTSPSASFGAWQDYDGLCTLEEHRDLPLETQVKDLFNTSLVDAAIIGDCYASEEELKLLGAMDRDVLSFNVELEEGVSEIEKKIVLNETHINRGDASEYVVRSTESRVKYRGNYFKLFNAQEDIKKGDLLIHSSLYERYAGELQVALRDMKNTGKISVVGRIAPEEVFLLDYLRPWQKFRFKLRSIGSVTTGSQ